MLDYPILLVFPIAMAYAAAMDLFTMTIPNRISLALTLGFFAAALLAGMPWSDILRHTLTGLGVLAVTIFMFARGWFGGGDAKLLAAAALWFGTSQLFDYMFVAAMLGGILAFIILFYRHAIPPIIVAGRDWAARLHDKKTGIPYGVALGGAGLWLYPTSDVFRAFAA